MMGVVVLLPCIETSKARQNYSQTGWMKVDRTLKEVDGRKKKKHVFMMKLKKI